MYHQNFSCTVFMVLCKDSLHVSYHFYNNTSEIVSDEHKWTTCILCRTYQLAVLFQYSAPGSIEYLQQLDPVLSSAQQDRPANVKPQL